MKPIVAAYISSRKQNREDNERRYDRERPDTMRGDWPIRQEYDMRNRPDSNGGYDWPYGDDQNGAEEYGMRDYRRYPKDRYGRVESRYRPIRSGYEDDRRVGLYDGGGIGFGAERGRYEPARSHYEDGQQREHRQPLRAGGTFWMEPAQEAMHFDRQIAEEWVEHMENSDPSNPRGGKWTPDDLKPLARKLGIPEDGEKYWEFYAMMNAMYSDYAPVAKKFGITSPEFYACLAKAWMEDKDAKDDKTALYYKYIVER